MENDSEPGPVCGPSSILRDRELRIRSLSERLVNAQRSLRLLDAIRWDAAIERAFFASGCREQPAVSRDYYRSRPLPFNPETKLEEFRFIESLIRKQVGVADGAGRIMVKLCREYRDIVRLLVCRGSKEFAERAARMFGRSRDVGTIEKPGGAPGWLKDRKARTTVSPKEFYNAQETAETLRRNLQTYFDNAVAVRVKLSNILIANASAASGSIKIRGAARFTAQDIRLLEVHEGWVHLGTTVNGQRQPICTFLAKTSPSATITQEGLAVLTEHLAGATNPPRLKRLTNRVRAIAMAEEGADFRSVYRYFEQEGYDYQDSYQQAVRIFRGSLPANAGPFTKDLSYLKGFQMLLEVCRLKPESVDWLFCGKTAAADLPAIEELAAQGLVSPPRFIPPPFANKTNLAAWAERQRAAA